METTKLRKQLVNRINNADEKLLKEIKALVDHYENDQVVAYTVQGKPLTREEMRQEIAEAEEEYSKGNFTIQAQLKEEIKSWKKYRRGKVFRN